MANQQQQLPCDGDGTCMLCKRTPPKEEKLVCKTCVTPWHVDCLVTRPELLEVPEWECPDCSDPPAGESAVLVRGGGAGGDLVAAIRAIEADAALSETEKARKRQDLMSGKSGEEKEKEKEKGKDDNELLDILNDNLKCSFCMHLPDRPVTTPCGHTFCLKCFEKWVGQGKKTCAKCREPIPAKMASQPRINSAIVLAIRMARMSKATSVEAPKVIQYVHNEDLPDEAFTTERAKKTGKANAKSGKIFVTIPNDHLGPITAEYDPVNNTGVQVGDCWADRLACRQWGAHFPHVSGIAGQADFGAQSVVLSGGYQDDEDHGEWFLYTGSGGRDLSGNKRTNKEQSSDQKFTSANQALRHSCKNGYPVRVIRSHKEKRSNYAPESGVRYDGIYRIEKCWRKKGLQGFIVCRYLFVRCDNSPAPWTSDELGDRPRALPDVPELKKAIDVTERKENPHWDFDEIEGCWKWKKSPPPSKKAKEKGTGQTRSKKDSKAKILKEFSCQLCHKVLNLPITTPCAHNFCKSCLDGAFEGQKFVRERKTGGRQLRTQKNVMKCPACTMDISEFLQNAQVNRELMGAIESLMQKFEEEEKTADGDDDEDAASEDAENVESDSEETEVKEAEEEDSDKPKIKQAEEKVSDKPMEKAQDENGNLEEPETEKADGGDKTERIAATKRGCKRKNDATGPTGGEVRETRGRKARRAADDGNVSPSSPLHVGSDNEPE